MLFVMHRPGLVGVSGVITESDGLSVTVQGDVYLPVSKKIGTRLARILYPRNFSFSKMKLRPGENIIALTEDDFSVSSLFNNSETNDELYELKAYQIRYSGVFDFKETAECAEEHLFSGQVKKIWQLRDGWKLIEVSVRKSNMNEERYLIQNNPDERLKIGSNIVSLTGKPSDLKGTLCYPVKKLSYL